MEESLIVEHIRTGVRARLSDVQLRDGEHWAQFTVIRKDGRPHGRYSGWFGPVGRLWKTVKLAEGNP